MSSAVACELGRHRGIVLGDVVVEKSALFLAVSLKWAFPDTHRLNQELPGA